jgi:hypothetical protein
MNQLPAKASYRADWDRLSLAELKDQDGYSYLLQWLRKNGAPAPVASEQINANTSGRIVELLFTNATTGASKAIAVADFIADPVDSLGDLYHAGVIAGDLMTRPEFVWPPPQAPAPPAAPSLPDNPVGSTTDGIHFVNLRSDYLPGARYTADPRGVFVLEGVATPTGVLNSRWLLVQSTPAGPACAACTRSGHVDRSGLWPRCRTQFRHRRKRAGSDDHRGTPRGWNQEDQLGASHVQQ